MKHIKNCTAMGGMLYRTVGKNYTVSSGNSLPLERNMQSEHWCSDRAYSTSKYKMRL